MTDTSWQSLDYAELTEADALAGFGFEPEPGKPATLPPADGQAAVGGQLCDYWDNEFGALYRRHADGSYFYN